MAMQTLEQEFDQSEQSLTTVGHPVLRGLMADQATAHAEEVRLLRQRVAVLEAALASAKAVTNADGSVKREVPHFNSDTPPCRTEFVSSEFSEPVAPAVVALSREDLAAAAQPAATQSAPAQLAATQSAPAQPAATQSAPAQTVVSESACAETTEAEVFADQGFAEAWTNTVATSFEERVAQRAFFQAGSVDEQSRNWLLTS